MKYLLIFLIVISFIGPIYSKDKSIPTVIKDGAYNYITSLDKGVNYLIENVEIISKLSNIPYKKAYEKVMPDRKLEQHLVLSGETIDTIIKEYNDDIKDLESFRKIIYKENPGIVSKSYEIKSGEYILVPSE